MNLARHGLGLFMWEWGRHANIDEDIVGGLVVVATNDTTLLTDDMGPNRVGMVVVDIVIECFMDKVLFTVVMMMIRR